MSGVTRTIWLAAALAGLAGCPNPMTTRLPTLAPAPNAAERQSQGHFDPYPDPNLGPETNTRPRDFQMPRTQQRQASEGRMFQGAPPAGSAAPGFSTGAYREDGEVVR
jgi:hypothetical protein